jgi:hypothetical protein
MKFKFRKILSDRQVHKAKF